MILTSAVAVAFYSTAFLTERADSFSTHGAGFARLARAPVASGVPSSSRHRPHLGKDRSFELSLFNRGNGDEEGSESTEEKRSDDKRRLRVPFFGRSMPSSGADGDNASTEETEGAKSESSPAIAVAEKKSPSLSAVDAAKALRAQAERARLEAERMDAELTLAKIEKLERRLATAKAKGESVDDLQFQMDNLQARLRGEAPNPVVAKKETKAATEVQKQGEESQQPPVVIQASSDGAFSTPLQIFDFSSPQGTFDLENAVKTIEDSPNFLKGIIATFVDVDLVPGEDVNATEVAQRLNMISQADYSFFKVPQPNFTQTQIDEEISRIKGINGDDLGFPPAFVDLAGGNETQLAIYGLEFNYYTNERMMNMDVFNEEKLQTIIEGDEWLKEVINLANQSAIDAAIENLYPKCTRKEGTAPSAQDVQTLTQSVLPAAKFVMTGSPEQVLGGYVIRGNHKYEKGDDLIRAIDKQLEKSPIRDSLTVLYAPDFTAIARIGEDLDLDFDDFDMSKEPPILYVTASDIAREPRRTLLTITSALGLGTSWYLAIYPFLLNPTLAKRIDEQLALADASMQFDLDWLTDLSVPLFLVFVGIQLAHELAHTTVAGAYNMTTSVPTFVPSLITGITSSVTSFKKPPPNNEALFDFALAGPLVGMLASIVAIFIGSQLTLVGDPSMLPALPLEILRQSTLGGGIIDYVLGNGALNVPAGALGSQAVAGMIIPLHPVAIAGYISLFLNALAVLPVGTTDGGRIAMSLFGRGTKMAMGNLTLLAMLLIGLAGSDLFLFYFSFVIAFQTGNEMPARDETEKPTLPRFVAALSAWFLAALALVPFQ